MAATSSYELYQQTGATAGDCGLQQQLAAGEGGRVEESGGARKERVVDSSGSLVGEFAGRLENFSSEARQASLARSYLGFRVAGQTPVEDVPRGDGQRGKAGTNRGFGPARESAAMFRSGPGVSGTSSSRLKPTIPVLDGKHESFSR